MTHKERSNLAFWAYLISLAAVFILYFPDWRLGMGHALICVTGYFYIESLIAGDRK
jgi:hypothetical protein